MAHKIFTADFHLGMESILKYANRPFQTVEQMNQHYIKQCMQANPEDIILHVGDLACFKQDRDSKGLNCKPEFLLKDVKAQFINIRGNHDLNNRVKSLCESMRIHLSKKFPDVSVSHYPTYDRRSFGHFQNGDIHICGHVHTAWRHCLDLSSNCLNINVGVDAWKHKLATDDQLIAYISMLLSRRPKDLFKCIVKEDGKVMFNGDPSA